MNERGVQVVKELAAVLEAEAQLLDWEAVGTFAMTLERSRRTLLFGAGRSHALALAFAQRLTHVGLLAATVGEAANARLGGDDSVVIVSGSGQTATALAIAQQAQTAGIGHLCLITATDESPLHDLAQIVVRLHGRAKGADAVGLAPFTAEFDAGVLCLSEVISRLVLDARGLNDADIENWRPNVE